MANEKSEWRLECRDPGTDRYRRAHRRL
jgi:hypothetical protein